MESVNDDIYEKWFNFLQNIRRIPDVHINRCYSINFITTSDIQLQVYSTVAYARIPSKESIEMCFIAHEGHHWKLCRLELQAAVLACRLSELVCDGHSLNFAKKYYWTDSMVRSSKSAEFESSSGWYTDPRDICWWHQVKWNHERCNQTRCR